MPTINGRSGTIEYEFRERLGVIPSGTDAWDKQLNLICWNHKEPAKYDIRGWSPEGDRMTRGITLFDNEMKEIVRLYLKYQKVKKYGVDAKEAEYKASEEAARRAAAERAAIQQEAEARMEAERARAAQAQAEMQKTAEEERAELQSEIDALEDSEDAGSVPEHDHYTMGDGASMAAEEKSGYAATEEEDAPF